MDGLKPKTINEIHQQFDTAIGEVLRQFAPHLNALEMLAVASYFVGKLVALQDQRVLSPEMALQIVSKNLEAGNHHAIQTLIDEQGGNA